MGETRVVMTLSCVRKVGRAREMGKELGAAVKRTKGFKKRVGGAG